MPVPITTVSNPQELEVEVSGPTPANRLFIITGVAVIDFATSGGAPKKETFTLQVGPDLTKTQFLRATALAAPAEIRPWGSPDWRFVLSSVDADWDDDSGKTELRIEVEIMGNITLRQVSFQATILAAL